MKYIICNRINIFRSTIWLALTDCFICKTQVQDKGKTLLSSSTLDKKIKSKFKNTGNKEAASEIGKILGEKAKEKGIKKVIFDRGKCLYHGRIKALADSARKAGLDF